MFNNSQLCSQAPSPQREPHHAAWTAAGSLLCVCSVTLISSMSMFPHLSRLQRWDLCCCFNNTAWYCPGGSLLCVSSSSLFSPICYAVYPNMERGAFQALHVMHRRTGTTCTYCGRKTHSLQGKWKFQMKSCLFSFTFFHLHWFSFFSTHIPPQWFMNRQTFILLAVKQVHCGYVGGLCHTVPVLCISNWKVTPLLIEDIICRQGSCWITWLTSGFRKNWMSTCQYDKSENMTLSKHFEGYQLVKPELKPASLCL